MPDDVTDVLDHAESLVFEVANRRQTTSLRGIHATLQDSLAHLESRAALGDTDWAAA